MKTHINITHPCSHVAKEVLIHEIDRRAEHAKGCEECLKIGGEWLHLRYCLHCGAVLCCESSPNQHMKKHAAHVGHPIITSVEPGETWVFCYKDTAGLAE
jgi:hypothetical protein